MGKFVIALVSLALLGASALVLLQARQKEMPTAAVERPVYCSDQGELTEVFTDLNQRFYCVKSDAKGRAFYPQSPSDYSFTVIDDRGEVVTDYVIAHTKLMHLIIVRKDLQYFQHLHPEYDNASGLFRLKDLTFSAAGQYRIFADFVLRRQARQLQAPQSVILHDDIAFGPSYQR